jgi:hypothetical protein
MEISFNKQLLKYQLPIKYTKLSIPRPSKICIPVLVIFLFENVPLLVILGLENVPLLVILGFETVPSGNPDL